MVRARPIVASGAFLLCLIALLTGAARADGGDGGAIDLGGGGSCGAVTIKGCCEGQILRYCAGGALKSEDCGKDPSCGWRADKAFYACGTSGASDPTGKHPKACPAPVDAGVDGSGADGPGADAAISDGGVDGAKDGATEGGTDGVVWKPPDQSQRDLFPAPVDARRDSGKGGGETTGGCGCKAAGDDAAPLTLLSLGLLAFGLARAARARATRRRA